MASWTFSHQNTRYRENQIKKEALLLSTKTKAQDVDVNHHKAHVTPHEVKDMVKAYNLRKKKAKVMKYLKIYLIKLSLKIFRRYFALKVFKRVKKLPKNAQKFLQVIKEKELEKLLNNILAAKIKVNHQPENPSKQKVRGFIGVINRRLPIFKMKHMQKRKPKQDENMSSAIPILSRATTVVSQSLSQVKVVRGKFNELSLKMRLEFKKDQDKLKRLNKNKNRDKKSSSSLPSQHLIHGLDRGATGYNM
jgi:hypothetical protein